MEDLDEISEVHCVIYLGSEFQTSGPLWIIELWASEVLGFDKWYLLALRVWWVWIWLFLVKSE